MRNCPSFSRQDAPQTIFKRGLLLNLHLAMTLGHYAASVLTSHR